MADITNVQAVKFSNEVIRPLANDYAQLYYRASRAKDQWIALGMGDLIPNDADAEMIDGAQTDGRPIITGQMINQLLTNVQTMLTDLEANSNTKLNVLLNIATSPGGNAPEE